MLRTQNTVASDECQQIKLELTHPDQLLQIIQIFGNHYFATKSLH